ncbi:MAG: UvrABC system protein B [Firmicutes bacterium ADurb.Bin182]|nr:MAG: UvrABC system protein B [Firmicutes bacterium ADurb.Bin182]
MNEFRIVSSYTPQGDQPQAIEALSKGLENGESLQVLMGVTGSGKTYTMANVIEKVQRPTLVIAHNKTLAAQLCSEFKELFPDSEVGYFVSYYDYYQPEAYIASSDTYIEKVATINDEIDKLRHSATCALNERRDVIIVASVSCIYALGDPEEYMRLSISLRKGMHIERDEVMKRLVDIQYQRNDFDTVRGTFKAKGDVLEILPMNWSEKALRVDFFGDEIERISEINTVTGEIIADRSHVAVFPASHYATSREKLDSAIEEIEKDLYLRVEELKAQNKLLEAQRLMQRTNYDIEMMREIGYCQGIENYSRYFDGRAPGQPPFTLIDYFPKDYLMIIDESHVTIPQIRAMYNGDLSRKQSLVDYGFRIPSAFDNRPLKFEEFERRINQLICVSATPAEYELGRCTRLVEQIIRPTGLVDPEVIIRPAQGQVDDLLSEIRRVTERGYRTLVTTLTKRMAEDLTEYLDGMNIRVRYMHSDIETIERMQIIRDLRLGEFDVLVGINLLREGLDLPEVGLVAILDADKEGFLRSEQSLIQTIGRAARNADGRVILYADGITNSMQRAVGETERRRKKQTEYNIMHGITPVSIKKAVHGILEISSSASRNRNMLSDKEREVRIEIIQEQMRQAAMELEFELAAKLRDELYELKGISPGIKQPAPGAVGSKKKSRARTRK